MYSFSEAAHLAHVSSSTVRNWILGYKGKGREVRPLFPPRDDQGPTVSFLQLVEIVVAAKFRKSERVSYERVKRAHENAQQQYHLEYPFAHLRLEAIGGHIVQRLHDEQPGASIQTLDEPQQWTLPGMVLDTIQQLEYERELAARWYPVGKNVPIVVDPRISAGLPTIEGRGVTIQAIYKRWKAGYRIGFIASDFRLEAELVERALQYAEQVAA